MVKKSRYKYRKWTNKKFKYKAVTSEKLPTKRGRAMKEFSKADMEKVINHVEKRWSKKFRTKNPSYKYGVYVKYKFRLINSDGQVIKNRHGKKFTKHVNFSTEVMERKAFRKVFRETMRRSDIPNMAVDTEGMFFISDSWVLDDTPVSADLISYQIVYVKK